MFENINFIKTRKIHINEYTQNEPAPLFRKKFIIKDKVISAILSVCGLGYGYYYFNGKKVTQDLLTAPVSNYNKTLWYNTYEVTQFVETGVNVVAVIVGNGFYNEVISTPWDTNKADWRDNPKFIYSLEIKTEDGCQLIISDDSWKCTNESPVIFNQLRNGEYFDARLYNENWNNLDFDDELWENALIDKNPPKGVFRECLCEPIREMKVYKSKSITKTSKNSYVFDLGQNISGYARIKINEPVGTEITIKYGERVDENIVYEKLDEFYRESVFQTDKFICNGKEFTWSPKFVYHGFSYIEIYGLSAKPNIDTVMGVFIHQDI